MNSDIELFHENPVFGVLSTAELDSIIQTSILRKYHTGDIITNAGDSWPYLFIVRSGSVHALKRSVEGRSLVVTTFTRGDVFWGLSFFYENLPNPVSLEAAESSRVYIWSTERLHPILVENGNFSWQLSRLMIDKMLRASEILEEMAFQPVAGRLAKLLLEGGQGMNEGFVFRSLTLDEMAARIGSTREVVCRFLHRFADSGIIDITRTEYRIIDQLRLQDLTAKINKS